MSSISLLSNVLLTFDIGSFLQNSASTLEFWGGLFITLCGLAMLIIMGFKVTKKLAGNPQQGSQISWGTIIALLIFGGAFFFGGIAFIITIARGGQKTIMDLGTGATYLPIFNVLF